MKVWAMLNSFATTSGHLVQTYWNGARRVEFTDIPFATARDATGGMHGGRCGAVIARGDGAVAAPLRPPCFSQLW